MPAPSADKQPRLYEFTLPQFVWNVSELVGSVRTTALQQALSDPKKYSLKEDTLTLTVEVELDKKAQLHWYYQPKPDVMVPKRMLTSDGLMKETYVGMVDDTFRED